MNRLDERQPPPPEAICGGCGVTLFGAKRWGHLSRCPSRLVTVCAACLTAACWQGKFYCDEYKTANVVRKTVAELRALHLEHADYWAPECEAGER